MTCKKSEESEPTIAAAMVQQLLEGETLFQQSSEGIMITDAAQVILRINPSFTQITGYSSEMILGEKPSILSSDRHDEQFYRNIFDKLTSEGLWQGEIWNRRFTGEVYPQWLSIIALKKDAILFRYMGIFTDITRHINKNTIIRNHAYYDTLTGLPNRMLLYDRLTLMLNLARRKKSIVGTLLLDINRFKIINDTLGYAVGDQLLQMVGERLKSCTRDIDSVFRLGDDEYAILLEEITQPQDASRVAKRILSACAQPFIIKEHELYITISIGVSLFPGDGSEQELLIKNAEAAMLRAKELGISNYQHYKPAMNTQAFEQLALEHNLQRALKKNEFVVYYQPLIDLKTMQIIGAEALIRWEHSDLGIVAPGQFIPLAEETGLIIPIGKWVLHTACRQMGLWQAQFNKPLIISVNLSARQFQQHDLPSMVRDALTHNHFNPDLLKLEITETIGMKNPEQTLCTLQELKMMGTHIAIDDFGTGYSSLSYLKKFPIDTIKIDRSFVSDIPADLNDAAIVNAIIAMAHSLKLDVIAEGVETIKQVNYLAEQGCDQLQGFFFSKPVAVEAFEVLLRNQPWIT